MHRFQLIKSSSHLELQLMCNVVYQRSLQNYQDSCDKVNHGNTNSPSQNLHNNYYTPAASISSLLPEHHELLTLPQLKNFHEQLEHATGTQLNIFIWELQTRDISYNDLVDKLIFRYLCSLAMPPLPRLGCTPIVVPEHNQSSLSINIVYFNQKLFLLIIGDRTKWSKAGPHRIRRLQDQITLLKQIKFHCHRLPNVIRGGQEFNKLPFLQLCQCMEIRFVAVVGIHQDGNATGERAICTIREHISRSALTELRTSLLDSVAVATFLKNSSRGRQKTSSFKLIYSRSLKLSTICNLAQNGAVKGNVAAARRRQMKVRQKVKTRTASSIAVGTSVYFWKGSEDRVGPGLISNIKNHVVHINHCRTVKFADKHRVQIALELRGNETETSHDDDGTLNAACSEVGKVIHRSKRWDEEPVENQVVQHDPILPVTIMPLVTKER